MNLIKKIIKPKQYKCIFCTADLNHQKGFDVNCGVWTCKYCGKETEIVTRKQKIKQTWDKAKPFIVPAVAVLGTVAYGIINNSSNNLDNNSNDDSYNGYIDDDLSSMSYYELKRNREEVRLHPEVYGDAWYDKLHEYDDAIRDIGHPMKEKISSMSDEELESESKRFFNESQEAYSRIDTKNRRYEDYYQDPDYIEYENKFGVFDEMQSEKRRRYAEANPGKFPIHREHGRYLPNDE